MEKILVIAYYYPPLGGGGVPRTLYFVKYLPEYAYCPVVLTGPDVQSSHRYWEPIDNTLIKKTEDDVNISRVTCRPPNHENIFKKRIRRLLARPDAFSNWWILNSIEKADQILRVEKVNLIYATLSPYASARVGEYLSKKYRIPWVADLRDPWALDELEIFPSIVHKWVGLWQMQKVLKTASAIIMNTPEAEKKLKTTLPSLQQIKTFVITNGYNSTDFDGISETGAKTKFRIVHSGYFYTNQALIMQKNVLRRILRGHSPGVNLLTGSPYFLIKAVEHWVSISPEVLKKAEVLFLGRMSEADLQLIQQSEIASKMMRSLGYVSHAENIRYLKSAALLFLTMHDMTNGDKATTVHGKTYEYMASGTPILAAVPEGDAKEILSNCGTAFLCKPDDWKCMTNVMMRLFDAWQKGEQTVIPNIPFIKKFDRKDLTGQLAAVFRTIIG